MSVLSPSDFDDWSTAVPDWAERITAGQSLIPDLPLHDPYADKALSIFMSLHAPDIDGFPTYGEVCDQFVFDLVRVIFGSFDPETKRRYLREFFVMIPKKNGKTAIAAAIILTACILNMSPEATFVLVAPSIELARNAFDHAAGIIKRTSRITKLFGSPQESVRTIRNLNPRIPSKIQIKAADGDIVTGLKNATVLIDETHVFANKTAAKGIFTEIRGALSHPQNKHFLLQITTQSKTQPAGVFKSELATARAVRDGKLARPMLALLYELPTAMAKSGGWKNEKNWPLVNPHLGRSVDLQFLRDELAKAEEDGAEQLALVASQHFNVEIGVGQSGEWVGATFWEAAKEPGLSLEELIARSEVAVMGVDGGGLDDLLAAAVIGRCTTTKRWLCWVHAFAHPEVLEQRKEIAPRLVDFQEAGNLTILSPESPTGDVEGVADIAERLLGAGLLPESGAIGLDPYGVSAIIDEMIGRGLDEKQLMNIPQGPRLSPAIWGVERKLKDGTLLHGGQPIMDWVMGNARSEQRGSAVMITKQASGKAKIDPLIALFNAFVLMSRNPQSARPPDLTAFLQNPVMVA